MVVAQWALTHTVLGRHIVAVGANAEAARLAGIDPRRVRTLAFTMCGALAGLAAVAQTGRLSAADPNAGIGLELEAIAAVVIGGTSLAGGRGAVGTSALGALVMAVLGAGPGPDGRAGTHAPPDDRRRDCRGRRRRRVAPPNLRTCEAVNL